MVPLSADTKVYSYKTMFTNYLDTRFPVEVKIGVLILQGKTVFMSERRWSEDRQLGQEGFGTGEMIGVINLKEG